MSARVRRSLGPLREFLRAESAGGVVLLAAVAAALAWANGPWQSSYDAVWSRVVTIGAGPFALTKDLQHWVNDGLMTLFFFVVGLEIKRELVVGELRRPRAAALPLLAGVSGAVMPAALFLALIGGGAAARAGWAVPMATDIAFAVGVLALLHRFVPPGARLILLSIAIVDDVVAIAVIAVAYTQGLSVEWLLAAIAGLAVVAGLRAVGVIRMWPFVLVGALVWLATAKSGVHATIAGVALAGLTPARPVQGRPVLAELEHRLHPVSAFVVVPLFALANAGLVIDGALVNAVTGGGIALAVVAGLCLGKPLGIAGSIVLARRLRLVELPEKVRAGHVWALGALAGIGFTVSLFVADLAYTAPDLLAQAKAGVLVASVLSAAAGAVILARLRVDSAAAASYSRAGKGGEYSPAHRRQDGRDHGSAVRVGSAYPEPAGRDLRSASEPEDAA